MGKDVYLEEEKRELKEAHERHTRNERNESKSNFDGETTKTQTNMSVAAAKLRRTLP